MNKLELLLLDPSLMALMLNYYKLPFISISSINIVKAKTPRVMRCLDDRDIAKLVFNEKINFKTFKNILQLLLS